jgi:hypothetical protein
VVTGKSLTLQITDFITSELAQHARDAQETIMVPYSTLATYLNKAEGRPHGLLAGQRIPDLLRPGAIKRKREQTPPEELGSEDERSYQLKELKEEIKAGENEGWI